MAAKSILIAEFEDAWESRALWGGTSTISIQQERLALMSDWFLTTTGEIIHVDGGYHAMA